jgi:hypothetical protein
MNRKKKKKETKDLYKYLEVLSDKFKSINEAKDQSLYLHQIKSWKQRINVFSLIKSN